MKKYQNELQLVTRQVAKLAKQKGFNWVTDYFYDPHEQSDGYINIIGLSNYDEVKKVLIPRDNFIAIPFQDLLNKWLRNVHGIDIVISTHSLDTNKRGYSIYYGRFMDGEYWPMLAFDRIDDDQRYDEYEEALEIALEKSLNLLEDFNYKKV